MRLCWLRSAALLCYLRMPAWCWIKVLDTLPSVLLSRLSSSLALYLILSLSLFLSAIIWFTLHTASTAVLPVTEIQDVAGPVLSSTDAALDDENIPTTTASSKTSDEDGGLLTSATQDFPKLQNKLSLSRDPQLANQQAMEALSEGKAQSLGYRPIRRGAPRPSTHKHFDINEHLPWMIVLLLLLVLVVIVVCSVKRSSRVLKKGPRQDPSSIMEKAIHKKPSSPAQTKERWIYYSNGQGELYFCLFTVIFQCFAFTYKTFVMEIIRGRRKNYISVLLQANFGKQSFSGEFRSFAGNHYSTEIEFFVLSHIFPITMTFLGSPTN